MSIDHNEPVPSRIDQDVSNTDPHTIFLQIMPEDGVAFDDPSLTLSEHSPIPEVPETKTPETESPDPDDTDSQPTNVPNVAPTTTPAQEAQPPKNKLKKVLIIGGVAVGGIFTAVIGYSMWLNAELMNALSQDEGNKPGNDIPPAAATLNPGETDQNNNTQDLIGSKNDMTSSEAQRIVGFFPTGDVLGLDVVQALADCSPKEIDTIRTYIDDFDPNNNSEITTILNQHGLDTTEVPINMDARISVSNDFTWGNVLYFTRHFTAGADPDDVRKALISAPQEDINILEDVLSGAEPPEVLAPVLDKYGIAGLNWAPEVSATFS